MKISISIKKIVFWLFGVILVLNGFSLLLRFLIRYVGFEVSHDFSRLFDTAQEGNVTAWFSSEELLFAGILLFLIALVKRQSADSFARHWMVMAWIFFFLSLDEVAGFHEKMIEPLRNVTGGDGVFYFAWVIVAIPLVLLFVVLYSRFLFHLPRKTAYQFVFAGAVFVLGAIGFEMLGGMFHGVTGIYRGLTAIEETLENLGAGLFIASLLVYMKDNIRSLPAFTKSAEDAMASSESGLIVLEIRN